MSKVAQLQQEQTVPVVMVNPHGIITYVNGAFEQVFLWARTDIVGKPLTTIIPREMHDAHNLGFSRFLTTNKPTIVGKALQLRAVKKDGSEFNAEHIIYAELQAQEWVFIATIRPLEQQS